MSRRPSAIGIALAMVPAGTLVAIGGFLAVRPAIVLGRLPELGLLIAVVDPGLVVLGLVILFVVLAPTLGITGRLRSSTTTLVDDESALLSGTRIAGEGPNRSERRPVVGATVDEQLSLATAYDDEPPDIRETARERLLESLRPIAATAYANRAGVSESAASEAIEAGRWTDDPRAAAFLAGPDGPSTPLLLWLFDLLTASDPFERHLERTLDEIERLQSTTAVAQPSTRAERAKHESVAGNARIAEAEGSS